MSASSAWSVRRTRSTLCPCPFAQRCNLQRPVVAPRQREAPGESPPWCRSLVARRKSLAWDVLSLRRVKLMRSCVRMATRLPSGFPSGSRRRRPEKEEIASFDGLADSSGSRGSLESSGELALRADPDEQRSPREAREVSSVRPRRAHRLGRRAQTRWARSESAQASNTACRPCRAALTSSIASGICFPHVTPTDQRVPAWPPRERRQ